MRRGLLALVLLLADGFACAHPLGNNTVNRQAAIQVFPDIVQVHYLVDLAEIPTLLAAQEADMDRDGSASAGEWEAYAQNYAGAIRAGIELAANAKVLSLTLKQVNWRLTPGAVGLSTLRLEAEPTTPLARFAEVKIEYRDTRRPGEAGWKEVIAGVGEGVRLVEADVPQVSVSTDLTAYPEAGGEMPNVLTARVEAALAAGPPADLAVQEEAGSPAATVQSAVKTPVLAPEPQALAFFRLGVHHIATGWDHLVFLLGLIVAQTSIRRLAWVVTAFTCAHSLTLGLAAGGLVSLPGTWVEPAIALTIVYVGLANLLGKDRHGAALTFAFGLVHGFGFAGALAESLGSALGGGSWLLDLAAFNLGIEAFQLALILVLLPLIRAATQFSWSAAARSAASLAVTGAGLGWFFARI